MDFLVISIFAIVLTGCDKRLSGTYKHEERGQIIRILFYKLSDEIP
jgi:uncharacterized lipoprotein YehR (DUF1307 family)